MLSKTFDFQLWKSIETSSIAITYNSIGQKNQNKII